MTSEAVLEKILTSLGAYYNINHCNDAEFLYARCDYFEHAENFVVSRKANLWSADSEEFMYIFKVSFLTKEIFESSIHYVKSDWEKHAHIGPGHMYTYITPIFICDKAEPMAAKLLRKFRRYKSYRFSFWGWSEFHTALIECGENKIITNRSGKCVRKSLGRIIHNS
ncbi:MAG: hypothetical protein MST12_01095 [Spirochaetia bacterium]|nr:hypothetical protein [uncultured Treponema sp.]MCI7397372.1 hypothetical protein [Spirochaetia bacterium]MCI7576836.1 hypothetical protein [Spirochaetia bacterium]